MKNCAVVGLVAGGGWAVNNVTGNPAMEQLLTQRLAKNGLSGGTDVLRITGAGSNASNLQ